MTTAMANYRRQLVSSPSSRTKGGSKKKVGLSDEQREEVREAFNLFDTDHTGSIDSRELKAAMRALGFDVKKDQIRKILSDIGKDSTASINYDEFEEVMTGRMVSNI
eukprot:TRINITY_DN76899_c0_g1_i1.p1 TRINITY_DN76899_c0_g1~~TRINITY_DN76899_c0_g1_i1.p1  ORF type:complete len:122 (-),score=16.95 TRINITY_DN76899_c0_g1_i1:53-373(-)